MQGQEEPSLGLGDSGPGTSLRQSSWKHEAVPEKIYDGMREMLGFIKLKILISSDNFI